ncbi:MAG: nucleotide exchange factor GrpE [Bacteroidales bacterium]
MDKYSDVKPANKMGVNENKEKKKNHELKDKDPNIKEMKEQKMEEQKEILSEEKQEKGGEKETELEESLKKVEEQKIRIEELNDKHIRLFSEFDNYRKRVSKEKLELIKTASESVVLSLLPVIDDFERALLVLGQGKSISSEEKGGKDPIWEGVELIYAKFMKVLEQQGVKVVEVEDKPFDPEISEAVAQIPTPQGKEKGWVLEVVQKGYKIEEKVIRFAKVVVGI